MTYGEIYKEFLRTTKINPNLIEDYRNCCQTYDLPYIPYAIIVWLKDGNELIYISENAKNYKEGDTE